MFLWQYQRQRKCFLSKRELRKALRDTLTRAAWLGPSNFDRFVLSMRMQVILDSSFARPGSAPIWGGKKGEFRDWTSLGLVRILKTCDLGPENIALGHSFFTIRTSQPANNIYMYLFQNCFPVWNFVRSEDFLQKQFLSVEISVIFIVPGALLPAVPGLALLYHIQKCDKVLSCLV